MDTIMKRAVVSWIGDRDLEAAGIMEPKFKGNQKEKEWGPIANSLREYETEYDEICLLDDRGEGEQYKDWLAKILGVQIDKIRIHQVQLTRPTDYDCVFETTRIFLDELEHSAQDKLKFDFLISPGTSVMTTTWILLSQMLFPDSRLIESSRQEGRKEIQIPFSIYARYRPPKRKKEELRTVLEKQPDSLRKKINNAFTAIQGESESLMEVLLDAKTFALCPNLPVLILGETGTGKELFAQAIHSASSRSDHPFLPVNMGAIPRDLIDAELFGHEKGSFAGAHQQRKGHFESAGGGTIFFDEIGNMFLPHQNRLLRILQDGTYQRVGSSTVRHSKCRVIAATNKNLEELVDKREFLPDLYERLNVLVVQLPPLRERKEDIPGLVNYFLDKTHRENKDIYPERCIDPKALELLISYDWPRNIRQLENVITRLCADSYAHKVIEKRHVEKVLTLSQYSDKLVTFVKQGLDEEQTGLDDLISDIEKFALEYAMSKHKGHKGNATKYLKLGNQTTLSNRLKKYPDLAHQFQK